MSELFKSEFFTDGATVYNLKDSMWLGKPSKSNEWCFGVQNTDATDDERKEAAKLIASAINTHNTMQARIMELERVIREADDYLNINSMTSIGSGSVLHAKFKQALKDNS